MESNEYSRGMPGLPPVVAGLGASNPSFEIRSITGGLATNGSADFSTINFSKEAEILSIHSCTWRTICFFLGIASPQNVKREKFEDLGLIVMLLKQISSKFMEDFGYKFAGELNFDSSDELIPCTKCTWKIGVKTDDQQTFTSIGYQFFQHVENPSKNVVLWFSPLDPTAGYCIWAYAYDENLCEDILEGLKTFAKQNNWLRGKKIRDVDALRATFAEVDLSEEYTWDKYYYDPVVRKLFEVEIFGFLDDVEKYNARKIRKRGFLMHGPPGGGKTTLGKIACRYVEKHTVIWITPEIFSNGAGVAAIRLLYNLAEYLSPIVIILEDIDLYSEDREHVVESTGLGVLTNVLDGVHDVTNSVTIAMTNRKDLVEKALRSRPGRFDRVIEIPALSTPLRRQMLEDRLTIFKSVDAGVVDYMVGQTNGCTGAEIQEIITSIHMYFIARDSDEEENVSKEIVMTAIETVEKFSDNTKGKKLAGFQR
jgi:hypothetical protein